ncbi:hypothetical protein ASPBRDRAFT_548427 [Aspergillus brasiliensis CBS 101740]|uniref:Uncharacterized protein n=1 Tax=Aspergillus brasiliensis (strain CBS 101740 / IMI 381727 / IBT 21946) TaxID=767769 RepID=A0A1L9UM50_ASPBC|nr:hypothetical protein ASPBRDRAFT_548427 [Aspergillus brasiliensis CBS 101740]
MHRSVNLEGWSGYLVAGGCGRGLGGMEQREMSAYVKKRINLRERVARQLSTPNARERVCICEALQTSESPDTLSGRPEAGIEAQSGRRSQAFTSTHIHARPNLGRRRTMIEIQPYSHSCSRCCGSD